ncbi:MAG: prepilin-type N-terminal cleavage/methylation domain-containing protein, partial [Planctomycetaceae bacterium]|nr:prepilin-type N-terminal cleavage/methylation domain-containing protein [Planctomycetaceae bacterium]
MKKIHSSHRMSVVDGRKGVTLVEVLMSLMIMSIGVSAVAVLFPISMLRSLRATQMTNGAILTHSVNALLDFQPHLVFDPDHDTDFAEHFQNRATRNYIVDPGTFYTLAADGNALATVFGNDPTGTLTQGFVPRFGGGLQTLTGRTAEGPAPTATTADLQALKLAAQALSGQGDGWTEILQGVP